jgi:DNA-binding NtrC family response regulator
VVFPGLSGVALAEHVETSERGINTLLISHFHPDLLRSVAGFSKQPEFLPNPFTPEALLTHVRRLLES